MDLNKYKDQEIRVKFIGGRQVVGILKGFDQLMNLVLDDVVETLRGMYNQRNPTHPHLSPSPLFPTLLLTVFSRPRR